jgi:hypothetical protein
MDPGRGSRIIAFDIDLWKKLEINRKCALESKKSETNPRKIYQQTRSLDQY